MFTEIHVNGELWWGVVSMQDNLWMAYKDTDATKAIHIVREDQ